MTFGPSWTLDGWEVAELGFEPGHLGTGQARAAEPMDAELPGASPHTPASHGGGCHSV